MRTQPTSTPPASQLRRHDHRTQPRPDIGHVDGRWYSRDDRQPDRFDWDESDGQYQSDLYRRTSDLKRSNCRLPKSVPHVLSRLKMSFTGTHERGVGMNRTVAVRRLLALVVVLGSAAGLLSALLQLPGKSLASSASTVPAYDHIVEIVMENHSYSDIIGNTTAAPYLNQLAMQGAVGANYFAVTHPSLPNYLALTGGKDFGVSSDCEPPTNCTINAPNLADRMEGAGKSWKAYLESMPSACDFADAYPYAAKHNPFAYFADIQTNSTRCKSHDVPYSRLSADLASTSTTPNFVMVVPNLLHDMHDGTISQGDAWLSRQVPTILNSPAFTQQRSLLAIVWDEDDNSQNNQVPLILVGSGVKPNYSSAIDYTHYGLLKTIETAWGLPALASNDSNAAPMTDFFQPAATATASPQASATAPAGGTATATSQPTTSASGKVYSVAPSMSQTTIDNTLHALQPGDTLVFQDGTYTTHLRLDPNEGSGTALHGTSAAWITIKAADDGQVTLNGQGTSEPFFVTASSYVTFQGFAVENSSTSVVRLYGEQGGSPNDHLTLQRITAHGAGSGNWHDFDIDTNSNITVEDSAAWGNGRYNFCPYHSSNIVLRRDFAYAPYTTNFSPAPRANYCAYGVNGLTMENDIGIGATPPGVDNNYYTAVWQTTDDTVNFPNQNIKYFGDVFYNDCQGYQISSNGGGGSTTMQDMYISIPAKSICQTDLGSNFYQPEGLLWGQSGGGSMTNMVFQGSRFGYDGESGAVPSLTNSVLTNNVNAIINTAPSTSYSDFNGNTNNGITVGGTNVTAAPGYDTATYGIGAYLMPAPALKGTGQNGADMGAHITYEYVNGVLTSNPLWPWPMESRIQNELGRSVTFSSGGGIWNTLTGVYPSTPTATPTPAPQSTATPQPVATATPQPTAAPSSNTFTIYGDSLASGWSDNSYDSTVKYSTTSPVSSGSDSIAWTATDGWSTFYPWQSRGFSLSSYTDLRFAAQASQSGVEDIVCLLDANSNCVGPMLDLKDYGGQPAVGRWTYYTLPLSALNPNHVSTIYGFELQNATDYGAPTVYLDSIQLTGSSS